MSSKVRLLANLLDEWKLMGNNTKSLLAQKTALMCHGCVYEQLITKNAALAKSNSFISHYAHSLCVSHRSLSPELDSPLSSKKISSNP